MGGQLWAFMVTTINRKVTGLDLGTKLGLVFKVLKITIGVWEVALCTLVHIQVLGLVVQQGLSRIVMLAVSNIERTLQHA